MKNFKISFNFETDDDWSEADVKEMIEQIVDPIYHLGDVFVGEVNVEEFDIDTEDEKRRLFRTLCRLADEEKNVKHFGDIPYKEITFRPSLEFIKDMKKWSEEE